VMHRLRKSSNWLIAYVGVFLLFLYAPALLLPLFAFNDSSVISFPLAGFTTQWFAAVLDNDPLHRAARNSLIVALSTAALSTTLGVFAARASTRYEFPAKRGMLGLVMVPMVLPEIIVGVSLLVVVVQLGLSPSLLLIILGHVLICTPFCTAILGAAFQGLDRSLEEASIDLGRTRFMTFVLITMPLVLPGIISSLLLSFTISLDEFIIAFFLTGTEATLPVYIWGQLRFPQRVPGLMALGTILLVVSLLLLVCAEYFRRRGARTMGRQEQGGFF